MAADNTQQPAATTATTEATPVTPHELSAEKMMMDNLLILGMLFFIFYFILIRPQQRKLKAHQKMLKELAKGNKVLTAGGVIGTISKFEGDDIVHLEVAQGVKLRIARSAITDVVNDAASGASANDN
ncbi:MAG: preprotein translocase subunit YajC [Alphaproteobacteria bacterium]|nr:preprotein translocase subunit YajC [Alphaproteobacteria bacterium]